MDRAAPDRSIRTTWPAALTLGERRSVLQFLSAGDSDAELARRRAERWQSTLMSFGRAPVSMLDRKLDLEELTHQEFLHLLGLDPRSLLDHLPAPPWVERVIEMAQARPIDDFAEAFDAACRELGATEYAEFTRGAVTHCAQRVVDATRDLDLPGDTHFLIGLLLRGLVASTHRLTARTLLVEFQARSHREYGATNRAPDRHLEFVRLIRTVEARLGLFASYPVLARRLDRVCTQWVRSSILLLDRLALDWNELQTLHDGDDSPRSVVEIDLDMGDRHRDGLSVTILTFDTGQRVVYKPRPVDVERHVHDLYREVNSWGVTDLRTWRVLPRAGYGWTTFIRSAPCRDAAEVNDHYHRIGHLLAVMYVLGATDMHRENLIASGAHPVAIDLETLLSPQLTSISDAFGRFDPQLTDSVLTSGLLPTGQGGEVGGAGVGFGDHVGTTMQPILVDLGTDRARIERETVDIALGQNVVEVDGRRVRAGEHVREIAVGFIDAYRSLAEHRDRMEPFVAAIADTDTRVVVRNTQTYAVLLQESSHPQLLRDGLEADLHFSQLLRPANESAIVDLVTTSELDDLLLGDVPLFSVSPRSTCVVDAGGTEIEGVVAVSGWDLFRSRVDDLGDADLAFQVDLIVGAFFEDGHDVQAMLAVDGDLNRRIRTPPTTTSRFDSTDETLIAAASNMVDRLTQSVVTADGRHIWIAVGSGDGPRLCAPTLDGGSAGICLFLAEFDHVVGQSGHLTAGAVRSFQETADEVLASTDSIGGFSGTGGALWAGTRLHALGVLDLAPSLEGWLAGAVPLIDVDTDLDMYAGVAGLGLAALSTAAVFPASRAMDVAVSCRDRLVATARHWGSDVVVWPTLGSDPQPDNPPFAGMAHGTAGIAVFLAEYWRATSDDSVIELIQGAMNYERSVYDADAQNWRRFDPLHPQTPSTHQVAWCHGSAGIGLSRTRLLKALAGVDHAPVILTDQELSADLAWSARSVRTDGVGRNDCLCHGSLGNLAILQAISECLDDPENLAAEIDREAIDIAHRLMTDSPSTDLPFGLASAGFLTGISGLGYGLLRLTSHSGMPDALCLEVQDPSLSR